MAVLVQVPPQRSGVVPVQLAVQPPATQTGAPPLHWVPQLPQWFLSVFSSTQLLTSVAVLVQPLAHRVVPAAQEALQVPPEQDVPGAQAWPQAPQLAESEDVFTQLLPHWT